MAPGSDSVHPATGVNVKLLRFADWRAERASAKVTPCGQPRPTKGILVAMTVIVRTLASSGSPAM